jgi:hypothetical protein
MIWSMVEPCSNKGRMNIVVLSGSGLPRPDETSGLAMTTEGDGIFPKADKLES